MVNFIMNNKPNTNMKRRKALPTTEMILGGTIVRAEAFLFGCKPNPVTFGRSVQVLYPLPLFWTLSGFSALRYKILPPPQTGVL